jgi:hypothetical protein
MFIVQATYVYAIIQGSPTEGEGSVRLTYLY